LQDGTLLLDWSASGIEFSAMCSGDVKVTFDAIKVPSGDTNGTYFTVIVDGVVQYADLRTPEDTTAANWTGNTTSYPFHITETGEITYTVASDLQYGKHTFEIYKQAEANYDILGIKSISLNGTFLSAPENKDLYIEVIGDSIAATASNLATGADGSGSMYQDATQGWPYMTARNLDADWSVIAKSGIMATEVPNHTSMQTAYKLQRFYSNDNATLYGFDRQPDVVVICLGTNDNYHANGEDIVAGMTQMLNLVREKNPDAKIVWIYGMMTAKANTYIKEAIANAGGIEKGFYSFELPAEPTGKHPKLSTQYLYTNLLSDYIESVVLNDNYKEAYATEKTEATVYRATDALDNPDGAYYSDKNSVWKFAVSDMYDNFKTSSPDFSAPIATITKDNYLKLSWEKPQNAVGKTILKVSGTTYNKELLIGGNSVILKDAPLSEKLQIQVSVGNISSELLTYYSDPVLTDITVTDSNKNETTKINPDSYLFADLSKVKNKINDNTGILIKLESVITDETITVTHYSDLKDHGGAFIERNSSSPIANFRYPVSLNDIGMSFNWRMTPATVNSDGTFKASTTAYTNNSTDRTRNFYVYDHALEDKPAAIKNTEQINFHITSNPQSLYTQFYKSGYILVPFEAFSDTDIAQIKQTGAISLKADTFFYRGRVRRNLNGNQDVNYVQYGCTSLDPDHTNEKFLGGLLDREMHYSEISFVNDFDAFVKNYVDDSSTTIIRPQTSVSSTVRGTSYMNPLVSGSDYNLTDQNFDSSYFVDDSDNYANKIIFTTAKNEKMKFGFTAPKTGLYEISVPITADSAKGIHYRLIKETETGALSLLQAEKNHSKEKFLCLTTAILSLGDTVYIELWSDIASTTVDIGIPQFIHLNNGSEPNKQIFKANDHLALNSIDDFGATSVWEFGTFVNPFIADGTEYRYLNSTDFANATNFQYDVLGISELSAYDNTETETNETDATALLDSFQKYDGVATYNDSNNEMFYQSKENGLGYKNSAYNIQKPFRYAWSGQMTVDKRKYNSNVYIRYGLALAAGGNQKNVYINFGHYGQFISPADGYITLDLGMSTNPGKVIVLHNSKVIATYLAGTLPGSDGSLDIEANKGDTISIAYATLEDSENGLTVTDTGNIAINPVVTFVPKNTNISSVTFDSKTPEIMSASIENGTVITLPDTYKAGAYFAGWIANGKLYNSGDAYTVSANTDFKSKFIYYGNLDSSDNDINANDLSIMRRILLGKTNIDTVNDGVIAADIDANGKINLKDLVRIKKIAAETEVSVGIS